MRIRSPLVLVVLATASLLPAQTPYGLGTPGSSGTPPRLSANQPWAGNSAFAYRIDRGLPNTIAALLLSTGAADTQVLGSQVWIDLAPTGFLFSAPLALDAQGTASLPGGLGVNSSSLVGARVHLQAVVADPPGNGAHAATTNGLQVVVTEPPLVFLGGDTNLVTPDPFTLLDPRTLQITWQAATTSADGATGAVFGDGGRDLFVAARVRGNIEHADLRGAQPVWRTFAALQTDVSGVELDSFGKRLYTVAGPLGGIRDLVVFDADPSSAGYGNELHRLPGITSLSSARHWELNALGDRLALYTGTAFANQLVILDTDTNSPTYLQEVERVTIEGLHGALNSLSRIRITGDGAIVFALLSVGYFTMPSGIMRYDTAARRWLDHNPSMAGNQPIGPFSSPRGPMITSSDLDVARDGSFATLTPYTSLTRIDFDRERPEEWSLVEIPATWTPSTTFRHRITSDGAHVLMLTATSTRTDSTATLIDAATGGVVASQRLPGTSYIHTMAQR